MLSFSKKILFSTGVVLSCLGFFSANQAFAEKNEVEIVVPSIEIPSVKITVSNETAKKKEKEKQEKERQEEKKVEENSNKPFTQVYGALGTSSIVSFGESLFTYIAKNTGHRDNFYFPYFYNVNVGFDHFINRFVGFGMNLSYESGTYKSFDSEKGTYLTDEYCSKYGFMGKFTFNPSKYVYMSVSLGAMFRTSSYYDNYLLLLPAINYCPFGARVPITDHLNCYFEFNLGSVSVFDMGLALRF